MKLAHNFRNFSRKINLNYAIIGRLTLALVILFICSFFIGFSGYLNFDQNKILGHKVERGINIKDLLNQAALSISHQNYKEANRQLSIILEFEPENIYAIAMNRRLDFQLGEIEAEILETVKIVEIQPNWREAWIKLADLYEKKGDKTLAAEARQRAKSLKTS